MILITTHRLLIAYSDIILQKKVFFSSCQRFCIGCGPFWLLNSWPFWPVLTHNFVCFFKYSPNFQGHAQKFELNKVWHANFIEFKYDRTNPQNDWAFEKTKKHMFFIFILLKVTFSHFFYDIKKNYLISWIYTKFMCSITFSYSHDFKKSGKKSVVSKKKYFISWIYTKFMCSITFSYSHDFKKSGKKSNFF